MVGYSYTCRNHTPLNLTLTVMASLSQVLNHTLPLLLTMITDTVNIINIIHMSILTRIFHHREQWN